MTKNISKSIRDRLMNISKSQKVTFQMIATRYFYERLLYRLSQSDYRQNFYLKGGALLYATQKEIARPTLDIDFLGIKIKNDMAHLKNVFTELCLIESNDGVLFDTDSITIGEIMEGNSYKGIRISILAKLDTIKQHLRVDVGFGDTIIPSEVALDYPSLIDTDKPISIIAYSLESVVAEKFNAMIEHGELNSRYKDFYDIYIILSNNTFDADSLSDAVLSTFKNRETPYDSNHSLFRADFATNSLRQDGWDKFLKKIECSEDIKFIDTINVVTTYLKPIYEKLK